MPTPFPVREAAPSPRRLTGFKVLLLLIAFFGIVFAVNGYMMYTAIDTFPGLATESTYEAGRRFPKDIAAAKAQAESGWTAELTARRNSDGKAYVSFSPKDASGAPVSGLAVTVHLFRPTTDDGEHTVTLKEGEIGVYRVTTEVGPGVYDIELVADGPKGSFRSNNRVVFPPLAGDPQ